MQRPPAGASGGNWCGLVPTGGGCCNWCQVVHLGFKALVLGLGGSSPVTQEYTPTVHALRGARLRATGGCLQTPPPSGAVERARAARYSGTPARACAGQETPVSLGLWIGVAVCVLGRWSLGRGFWVVGLLVLWSCGALGCGFQGGGWSGSWFLALALAASDHHHAVSEAYTAVSIQTRSLG